jgi:hypothetical protein
VFGIEAGIAVTLLAIRHAAVRDGRGASLRADHMSMIPRFRAIVTGWAGGPSRLRSFGRSRSQCRDPVPIRLTGNCSGDNEFSFRPETGDDK